MEGVTGMMARLSHMQRVAAGGSAMYRTRVFFSDRVRATVATSRADTGFTLTPSRPRSCIQERDRARLSVGRIPWY